MTVTLPYVTAATAGAILLLQMILMIQVGRHRTRTETLLGEGSDPVLQRAIRAHANLAENAALFLVALALIEMLGTPRLWMIVFGVTFVAARIAHAIGLSRTEAPNASRFLGALGTLVVGVVVGCVLLWMGIRALIW